MKHRLDAFDTLCREHRTRGPFSGRLRLMLDIEAHDGVTIYTPDLNVGDAKWIDSQVHVEHHERDNNTDAVDSITADEIVIAFDTHGVNLNDDLLRGMFVAKCHRDFESLLLNMLADAQREVNEGENRG